MNPDDLAQQTTLLGIFGVLAVVLDGILLFYWGWNRLIKDKPVFAPKWSVMDVWVGIHAILVLLIMLCIPLMVVAFALNIDLTSLSGMSSPKALFTFLLPATILQNVAFFVVPAGYIVWKYRMRLREIGLPLLPRKKDVIAGLTLGLLALIVGQGLGLLFGLVLEQFKDNATVAGMLAYEKSNPVAQMTQNLQSMGYGGLILGILAIGISAAFGEEMLFRGFAMNAFSKRFGPNAGLILSALLFAAPHTYSPLGLSVVFLLGLFMGWVYRQSGSLWVPIFVHATNNTVLVIAAFYFPNLSV